MNGIYEQVKVLAGFLILMNILTILLPNENYQKYLKVVSGMILIFLIINPVLSIFGKEYEDLSGKFNMENDIISEKKSFSSIDSEIYEVTLNQYSYEIEQKYIGNLKENGFAVENIDMDFEVDETSVIISEITIYMDDETDTYVNSLKNATDDYMKDYFYNELGINKENVTVNY